MYYGENRKHLILLGMIILSMLIGGGYFVTASALSLIPLVIIFLFFLFKEKKLKIYLDWNFIAIAVLVLGYLLSTIWAVDSGMALMGWVKYFPVLFFLLVLYNCEDGREKTIEYLPLVGVIMTIISVVFKYIPALSKYVTVAGRLGGFFQYPNTYALFMLVCLVILSYRIKEESKADILDFVYLLVCLAGIYFSGSRTVLVLTLAYGLYFAVSNIKNNKKFMYLLILVIALIILGAVLIAGTGKISHLTSKGLSTFWGRLLYYYDALPYILRHPLGTGYYGYAFTQYEFQTGVYTVVNVHNELLQFMLDIGWVPAILFYGTIIKTIFSKSVCQRNRAVLTIMLLHSLFDFDFKFISIMFVLILFLENKNLKEYKISYLTKGISVVLVVAAVFISVKTGASEGMNLLNKSEDAVKLYSGNTMAKVNMLYKEPDLFKAEEIAVDIIKDNEHIPDAYSILADAEFAKGNIDTYMEYKEKAISLAPYNSNFYKEYIEVMNYCMLEYLNMDDEMSYTVCAGKIIDTANNLEDLKERTSKLGWMIKDQPETELEDEYMDIISKAKTMYVSESK